MTVISSLHKHSTVLDYNLTQELHMEYEGKKYYLAKMGYWIRDERINGKRKGQLLHRKIWEDHFGLIPEGAHIHHKDDCRTNNAIDNLECLLPSQHFSHHRSKEHRSGNLSYLREAKRKRMLTQEGREAHSDGCRKGWVNRRIVEKSCELCGTKFETKATQRKWCSKSCKYKHWYRKNQS